VVCYRWVCDLFGDGTKFSSACADCYRDLLGVFVGRVRKVWGLCIQFFSPCDDRGPVYASFWFWIRLGLGLILR
jgi:hypothetical protein